MQWMKPPGYQLTERRNGLYQLYRIWRKLQIIWISESTGNGNALFLRYHSTTKPETPAVLVLMWFSVAVALNWPGRVKVGHAIFRFNDFCNAKWLTVSRGFLTAVKNKSVDWQAKNIRSGLCQGELGLGSPCLSCWWTSLNCCTEWRSGISHKLRVLWRCMVGVGSVKYGLNYPGCSLPLYVWTGAGNDSAHPAFPVELAVQETCLNNTLKE